MNASVRVKEYGVTRKCRLSAAPSMDCERIEVRKNEAVVRSSGKIVCEAFRRCLDIRVGAHPRSEGAPDCKIVTG